MISAPDQSTSTRQRSKWQWIGGGLVGFVVAIGLVVWLWDWNWFRPLLEARLSAALGRPVSIQRLEVRLGRVPVVTAQGVNVGNPSGIEAPDLASISRMSVSFDLATWLQSSRIVLPSIELDEPKFNVVRTAQGETNWPPAAGPSGVDIGEVEIRDGVARVHSAREKSDVTMTISTKQTADGGSLIIDGKGTHARQPITFHAAGGTLLALRNATKPYPVDFELANGETRITLKGHITDPLALRGADLALVLAGPDMELLLPLTGIATPQTPPYRLSGRLDFADGRIKFSDIVGRVGSSDLGGTLDVDTRGDRPVLTGALTSRKVDMEDLGGFIGSTPGRVTTPGQTAGQVEEIKRAEASPRLLPTTPISVPKVRAADVHLTYRGDKILGRRVPFDSIAAKLDIDNGYIRLSPLRLGIGGGALSGTVDLNPVGEQIDASADVTLEHINIANLLAAAGVQGGQGSLDGTAKVTGRGASLAAILAHGDGTFHAVMPSGGNISTLLVDLLGIELGRAFFAAIGIPQQEDIRCMVADFALQHGILASRTLEVDTTGHIVTGGGRIILSDEAMELVLRADPKQFTIGSLPTPILISGHLKDLRFAPAPEMALRGGAAIGLGLLFPPAALLPTIQFGVGEHSPCAAPAQQRITR